MNILCDNFIGIYEDAYTSEFCDKAIKYFEEMKECGFTTDRLKVENIASVSKDDEMLFAHGDEEVSITGTKNLSAETNNILWDCYKNYAEQFSAIKTAEPQGSFYLKLQKTKIGGGYHVWHFESDTKANSRRLFSWILYLNDVEEGGETEFLYLAKRIKPKKGTLVIFPAHFTHTHRGNPPISNEKYIITGWIEF